VGALALDQARLDTRLQPAERAARLETAEAALLAALPWKSDTVYIRLGLVMQEQGKAAEARAYWAQAPSSLAFLVAQGDAQADLGRARQAKSYYEHAAAVFPSSSSALLRMGAVAASEGRLSDALAMYGRAAELDAYLDPDDERPRTYVAIGQILDAQGRSGEAVAMMQKAEALMRDFTFQADLAMAMYHRDGNARAAEAYLQDSMKILPQQISSYVALMSILRLENRGVEALELGLQTARLFPTHTEPVIIMGRIYLEREDYDRAEEMFERARALRPRLIDAYLGLWSVAQARQDAQSAVAALREASALAPDDAHIYALLGDAEKNVGNLGEARKAYLHALELDPQNGRAQRGLDGLK